MKSHYSISSPPNVLDVYGRTFKTLRVSLTEVCNMGCVYCVESIPKWEEKNEGNLFDLIEAIKALHSVLDLNVIRLTGGEPTIYRNLIPLVQEVAQLGISVKMTTNGLTLASQAESLKKAGLQSINVSLDAVELEAFKKVTRNEGLSRTIAGIDKALEAGMEVKLNAVILKGWNENQILPLLEFANSRNIVIRFLELMRMGHLHSDRFDELLVSQKEILDVIRSRHSICPFPRDKSSTATYWKLENGHKFGVIANESEPFCGDCDRLRLDRKGNVYGCLSEKTPISISDCLKDKKLMMERLKGALDQKQPVRFSGSTLTMIEVGG